MMVGPIGRKLSVDQDLHRSAATRTGWSASAAAKGEGATVWNRRNLFIHDGFGEGRFTTQLSRSRRVLRAAGMGQQHAAGLQLHEGSIAPISGHSLCAA